VVGGSGGSEEGVGRNFGSLTASRGGRTPQTLPISGLQRTHAIYTWGLICRGGW
jgi:hypothetical protein